MQIVCSPSFSVLQKISELILFERSVLISKMATRVCCCGVPRPASLSVTQDMHSLTAGIPLVLGNLSGTTVGSRVRPSPPTARVGLAFYSSQSPAAAASLSLFNNLECALPSETAAASQSASAPTVPHLHLLAELFRALIYHYTSFRDLALEWCQHHLQMQALVKVFLVLKHISYPGVVAVAAVVHAASACVPQLPVSAAEKSQQRHCRNQLQLHLQLVALAPQLHLFIWHHFRRF